MSVLMKGIPMPKDCLGCGVQINPFCVTKGIIDFGTRGKRPENCPLVEAPEWISVKERLPGREWVLCKCRAKIHEVLSLRDGYWYHDPQHKFMGGFVTHWMPLPAPPEEET